ncbi:hypothetical protein OVA29_10980 [Exiguobacterium sp. SL14]|nr:hypothetical protein [Exiguobacterium sp. SL14]MCY1691137.1 hypothetical protein [Exiguobacterium sp. SL14]
MRLNIGFIGFGKSTTRYHLPYVMIEDNYHVTWIYNRKEKAGAFRILSGSTAGRPFYDGSL